MSIFKKILSGGLKTPAPPQLPPVTPLPPIAKPIDTGLRAIRTARTARQRVSGFRPISSNRLASADTTGLKTLLGA